MKFIAREGRDRGDVKLYALSTCVWCGKVKKLLADLGVKHEFIDVDELTGKQQAMIREQLDTLDPDWRFPCLVIDGGRLCICGYKEKDIREALGS